MIIANISIAGILVLAIVFLIWKTRKQANDFYSAKGHYDDELHRMRTEINKVQMRCAREKEDIRVHFNQEKRQLQTRFDQEKEKCAQLQKKIDSTKCLICGDPSKGKAFCFSCYSKYKNQSVDIRVKNCKDGKIIDLWGNKTEPCEDGRKVRSRAEQCIANYFYNNKIRYAYERPLSFQGKTLHPDFYLPDYDIYIEYNELQDEEYQKKKVFAMQIYKQMNVKIIVMTKEDRENIYEYFSKLLHR